jgi:hypothetical protein
VYQRDQIIEGSLIAIAPGDGPLSDFLGRGRHGPTNFQTGLRIIFFDGVQVLTRQSRNYWLREKN